MLRSRLQRATERRTRRPSMKRKPAMTMTTTRTRRLN